MIDHPSYFQSKMLLILHLICEQIVSAKKLGDAEGALFRGILNSAEFVNSAQNKNLRSSLSDQLVRTSINLFATLFLTK